MARPSRLGPPGITQHILQRGHNFSKCFFDQQDYKTYLRWLNEYSIEFGVDIHAWVLMENHIHLLVTPQAEKAVSRMMQAVGRRYVRYFNSRYERSGTLWEGRFRSCLVEAESYVLQCYRFIELNPLRAKLVRCLADYPWSSYQHNILGHADHLCTLHPEYEALGPNKKKRLEAYRRLFDHQLTTEEFNHIAQAILKGSLLGCDVFKMSMERRFERRLSPARKGRPKKLI